MKIKNYFVMQLDNWSNFYNAIFYILQIWFI